MQKAERELIDEKFKGVHALIQASNKTHDTQHKALMVVLKDVKTQTTETNGRVTKLEKQTRFFRWIEKNPRTSISLGIVLFFGSIAIGNIIGWDKILTKFI